MFFLLLVSWQMDGFDQTVNVKVIMATNRADTLDPALLRPGRLDRKIEFPLPDRRQKRLVFQVLLIGIPKSYSSNHQFLYKSLLFVDLNLLCCT
jgi:ATP-dependent 26S proteasome regulatory subunit